MSFPPDSFGPITDKAAAFNEWCVLTHRSEPDKKRRAAQGALVCYGCLARMRRDLIGETKEFDGKKVEIPGLLQLDADLVMAHVASPMPSSRVSGGGSEPPLPINVSITDLRIDIAGKLMSWACLIAEERDVTPPPNRHDIAIVVHFLEKHLDWAIEQPWIDEFDQELRKARGQAFSTAFGESSRSFKVADCPQVVACDTTTKAEIICGGNLMATLRDRDKLLPSVIWCKTDLDHEWTADTWRELSRRIPGVA